MIKFRAGVAFATALLVAGPALAVTTDPPNTTEQSSNVATSTALLRTVTKNTTDAFRSRLGGFLGPEVVSLQGGDEGVAAMLADDQPLGTGMSAGAGDGRLGIWVSGGWTGIEDDLVSTAYDGDVYNVLFGGDYQFNDRFLAGLAIGFESADIDTTYNTGNVSSDGWTIAPYAGYVLNRYFTVDVSGGFSFLDYDMRRTAAGSTVTGEMDSDRWFLAGALNGYYAVNKVLLSGRASYSYTREDQDGFTESDGTVNTQREITIGELRFGAQIGYDLGKVQPYLSGTFVHDAQMTKIRVASGQAKPANDRSGFDFGGGIRFALSDRVSGGVEGTTHLGRDDFDSTSISGNLRIKF
jgi:outer membrane autotransporter protein